MTLILKSPAKINLFLRLAFKRPDGYFELQTLMQAIDLHDQLTFLKREGSIQDKFSCNDPELPLDERNLVVKAIQLFRKKTGTQFSVDVHLEKKIPVSAGLGGGSSNAATTLFALNRLSENPVEEEKLREWAGLIGSDIAFFFSSGSALCTGRGEQVESLEPLVRKQVAVVKPQEGLATKDVYALGVPDSSLFDAKSVVKGFYEGRPSYFNDLEQPAFKLLPKLSLLQQTLQQQGFQHVMLSGSGSSLFCLSDKAITPLLDPSHKVFSCSFTKRKQGGWYA